MNVKRQFALFEGILDQKVCLTAKFQKPDETMPGKTRPSPQRFSFQRNWLVDIKYLYELSPDLLARGNILFHRKELVRCQKNETMICLMEGLTGFFNPRRDVSYK